MPQDEPLPVWGALGERFSGALQTSKHLLRAGIHAPPGTLTIMKNMVPLCRALSEVYSANPVRYGSLDSDPPTVLYIKETLYQAPLLLKGRGATTSPNFTQKMRAKVEEMRALQDELKCFYEDFGMAREAASKCASGTDHSFLTHHPIPEAWAVKYPLVVCFWRAIQRSETLACIWGKWAGCKGLVSWTDITPSPILSFIQDTLMLCLDSVFEKTFFPSLSVTFSMCLRKTFGCSTQVMAPAWAPMRSISAPP